MQRSLLAYLDGAERDRPDKVAYRNDSETITFGQVAEESRRIGSALARVLPPLSPVVVLAEKGIHVASLYLGTAAAGCFYIPLDAEMPPYRLGMIFDIVRPKAVLTDNTAVLPQIPGYDGVTLTLESCLQESANKALLAERRAAQSETDPLYVIYTSGSSGRPKGVITSHRAVLDCIDIFAETFGISESDVLGNQSPLDYIAALRDLYLPLRTGAETVLIRRALFSTPGLLFAYLNRHRVTVLCWTAAALSLCSELGAFDSSRPESVEKVFFAGSVMPCRHLRVWQTHLPEALFVNHYGPTEITSSCTYHILDHRVEADETVPIGQIFPNRGVYIVDEEGRCLPDGEMGEIAVSGVGLALGYYKDPERTRAQFIIDPNCPDYPRRLYKTGDLGIRRADGCYTFHGRRDGQIKHMGHRIELSEIESAALSPEGTGGVCCLYKPEKEQIWLFYTGRPDKREMAVSLRARLPAFMVPRKIVRLEALPKTPSGKVDMSALKEMMGG